MKRKRNVPPNTPKKGIPIVTKELLDFKFRLKNFYVLLFDFNLEPAEVLDKYKFVFNNTPTLGVNTDLEIVGVDLETRIDFVDGETKRIIGKFNTRTEFETQGLNVKKDGEKRETTILLPNIQTMMSLAISTTRGALSVISGGKFLMPVIDINQFKFNEVSKEDGSYVKLSTVQIPNASLLTASLPPS